MIPVMHDAIVWASEAGRAAHAAWVAEERARIRAHRLAEARSGFAWATCTHAPQKTLCPICAETFLREGHEAAAIATIDARIAEEEALALARLPHITIGEHWEIPHPDTGEVVQGLVMGGWPTRRGALAFHPLGPDRKSIPAQSFPVPLADLIAKGRRWS